ncbi:Flavin-containing monooxygenase [Musa troglodytarum]|uniref:Flavin-containing monooxygenase n=2 Tax=Musa troglodytarum TaxID=320322 RepID=A0A9E7EYS0_9LILI|nr:Flavin-containing monooxygenase [Musa troglodytarum]
MASSCSTLTATSARDPRVGLLRSDMKSARLNWIDHPPMEDEPRAHRCHRLPTPMEWHRGETEAAPAPFNLDNVGHVDAVVAAHIFPINSRSGGRQAHAIATKHTFATRNLASMPPSVAAAPAAFSRVAVIGAGAAGLVAARELRREGLRVVVFERDAAIGGTWVYTPATESDPLGLDPGRGIVQTSLYESLRTNLPRECMGFLDYPFSSRRAPDGGDTRRFPGHREVETVERDRDGRWQVDSRSVDEAGGDGGDESEAFDGVVVCNGHFTEPRIAEIPGIDAWPGKQLHSHNYRVPEPFTDQVVLIIGSAASAVDISRDIVRYAKEVHISNRSLPDEPPRKQPGHDNMWLHSMIASTHSDGTVVFQDGSSVQVDVIIHCTGYNYHFPFLKTNGIITVDDNCVGPLYKHVFPPSHAPSLAFIGIPWKVAPFLMFELQSKWVAGVLSRRISLPTKEEMLEDFEYHDWLAKQCELPPVAEWRNLMYEAAGKNRVARPESYRDEWDDDHLISQAEEDFRKFSYHIHL